jgi:hypothetical protein
LSGNNTESQLTEITQIISSQALRMAKLDAGRYEVAPAPVDLRETVDKSVNLFRGTKHAEGRSISVASDTVWPEIEAHERAVRPDVAQSAL